MPCDECKAAYLPNHWDTAEDKKRKAKGPACATCIPDQREANEDATMIYRICSGQLIISPMGGAIDINILAVKTAMDLYQIEDQKDCLGKVLFLFRKVKEGQECN